MIDENSVVSSTGIDIVDEKTICIDNNHYFKFDKLFQPEIEQVLLIVFRLKFIKNVQRNLFKAF